MRFLSHDREAQAPDSKRQMKLLAVGLPRCATSSLQEALESEWLDCYPTMHMAHIVPWPERSQLVVAALREDDKEKRQKILHKLFDGYAAICDFPGIAFTDDLMDMYPEAKILLNLRPDPNTWGQSVEEALMFFNTWVYRITTLPVKTDRLHVQMHLAAFDLSKRRLGTGRPQSPEMWRVWHDKYIQFARDEARKRGRAVVDWKPQDGWAPICELLGKPMPPNGVPFPHSNDRQEMQRLKIILVARGLCCWALLGAGVWLVGRFLLEYGQ
ncbi:hypothetical protein F5Y07DRAFT_396379 [Xylaria sp. FL0933]|nr:hypothetical protein F5Y07DRAFT_396379 [Xylaria sp. FL0933]